MPVQDGLGADRQQKVPQSVFGEVVEQVGEGGTVAVGEGRLADLTLEDQQLVPEDEDLDVLVSVAHRQEA
ncbi:hypothetical protein JBE27_28415 [Streptomyces albiflaviniger]|nr:hypothetical protein [Streptomyces albiflaviniger]